MLDTTAIVPSSQPSPLAIPSAGAPDPAAWETAAADWLHNFESERTRATYAAAWHDFLAHAQRPPWVVKHGDVIAWRDDLAVRGKADATIAQRLAAVSSFYRYAQEQGIAERNPAAGVKRPRVRPYDKAAWLSEDQARRVLAAVRPSSPNAMRDRALLAILLTMGLRRAELLGIRRGDIIERPDGTAALCYRPKGKSEETRSLPLSAWRALRPHVDAMGSTGPAARVFDLTPEGLRYIVRRYTAAALGKPISPHGMRHTAASILYRQTGRPADVQAMLGHARITTTEIYVHNALADDRRALLGDIIGDALGL